MATPQKKKKNPAKSGNPAIRQAALNSAKAKPQQSTTLPVKKPAPVIADSNLGYVPAGLPELKNASRAQSLRVPKKKSRWLKFIQVLVTLAVLSGLVLTSLVGLVGQDGGLMPDQSTPTEKVLVDSNGNPLDGSKLNNETVLPPALQPVPAESGNGESDSGESATLELPSTEPAP